MPVSSSSQSFRPVMLLIVATLFAAAVIGYWLRQGQPVAIGEAAAQTVQCLSYAPFRKPGESPFIAGTRVGEARLAEDLKLLSARTRCVRTYSVQQGLDAVPRLARSLGMKVLLGVWLGRDRAENELELQKAIALAREYPDTVSALVVGNEVLLRRELSEPVLAEYIDRARSGAGVPVTYADVWEFWSEHKTLARHVSFVTIHILPYWEDEPVGIDAAIDHIVATAESMRKLFEGKEILIGETGWPSAGRPRRAAVASRVNQARFFRHFSVAAAEHGFRYNFIEAFDQPWKRRMEGAMGGNWGLFDSDGRAKFPATGPVEEDPGWRRGLYGAGIGALLFGALALRRRLSPGLLATAAVTGAATGGFATAQWHYMMVWNRTFDEWTATLFFTVLAVLFPVFALAAARAVLKAGFHRPAQRWGSASAAIAEPYIPPLVDVVGHFRGHGPGAGRGITALTKFDWLGLLRFAFLFGAAAMTLLLVFDARYRGFPWPLFAPALMALMLARAAGIRGDRFGVEEALLATITLIGSIAFLPMERLSNTQALVFGLQMILLAGFATGFRFWRGEPTVVTDLRNVNRAGA
ncbi:MAG: hypothetical protein AB7G13_08990 [Lautropia sp.]